MVLEATRIGCVARTVATRTTCLLSTVTARTISTSVLTVLALARASASRSR